MLSCLKGSALECFEPALLDPVEPPWLSDFDLFLEELQTNFGVYDPVGEAKVEIEISSYAGNHQATKYFIKFMQLATCILWGQAALQRQAYKGLAKLIKNDMVHHDKPTSLAELGNSPRTLMHNIGNENPKFSRKTQAAESSGNKSEQKSEKVKSQTSRPVMVLLTSTEGLQVKIWL